MFPQTTINTFKKCEGEGTEAQSELMVAASWWLFSKLQKNSVLQVDRSMAGVVKLRLGSRMWLLCNQLSASLGLGAVEG